MRIINQAEAAREFTSIDMAVQLGAQGFDGTGMQLSAAGRGRAAVTAAIIDANPAGGTYGNFAGWGQLSSDNPVPASRGETEACAQERAVVGQLPGGMPDTWHTVPAPNAPFEIGNYAGTLIQEARLVIGALRKRREALQQCDVEGSPTAYMVASRQQLRRLGDATRVIEGISDEVLVGVQNSEGEIAGAKEFVTRLIYRVAVIGLARKHSLSPEELVRREQARIARPMRWLKSFLGKGDSRQISAGQAA